ncbi:hypothetical protein FRC01_000807 [Tulasnella sp. 417]|nr:hypothetical protein FRC01_000807 [Tulasnella sp. 417]
MVNTVVHDSFVKDICALIRIACNITELRLHYIRIEGYTRYQFWERAKLPNDELPDESCTLRTVDLIGLHGSIVADILEALKNCHLAVLNVDDINPEDLKVPKEVGSAIVRKLGFLPNREISFTAAHLMTYVNWRSRAAPSDSGMSGNDERHKLESGRIGFSTKQVRDRKALVDSLSALGVLCPSHGVEFVPSLDQKYPTTLSHAKILIVDPDNVVSILRPLAVATQEAAGPIQYPCPLLEELIFLEPDKAWEWDTRDAMYFQELCKVVAWRQWIAGDAEKIAKLKRLGVPYHWIERIKRAKKTYPAFDGIEIYDTKEHVLS